MVNQMVILLVIGSVLGLFGGNVISKLNPFKTGKVAVAKQEMQKEEYFKDKIKGVEYRITERSKGQTPVKQKRTIGSIIDNSFQALIKIGLIMLIASLFLGVNLFKYVRRLKNLSVSSMKALTQVVVGTQKAKASMNGEKEKLRASLRDELDQDSKKIVREIKDEKSI